MKTHWFETKTAKNNNTHVINSEIAQLVQLFRESCIIALVALPLVVGLRLQPCNLSVETRNIVGVLIVLFCVACARSCARTHQIVIRLHITFDIPTRTNAHIHTMPASNDGTCLIDAARKRRQHRRRDTNFEQRVTSLWRHNASKVTAHAILERRRRCFCCCFCCLCRCRRCCCSRAARIIPRYLICESTNKTKHSVLL